MILFSFKAYSMGFIDFDLLELAPKEAVGVLVSTTEARGTVYVSKMYPEDSRNFHAMPINSYIRPIPFFRKSEYRYVSFDG